MFEEIDPLDKKKRHYRPSQYLTPPYWQRDKQNFTAPVVPPAWVMEKLKQGEKVVEWNNTQRVSNCPCCEWPMRYLSEVHEGQFVTYLLPGSAQPVEDWLGKR